MLFLGSDMSIRNSFFVLQWKEMLMSKTVTLVTFHTIRAIGSQSK